MRQGEPEADFFNVIAWSKQAEFVANHFQQGHRIIVHGEMRNVEWKDEKQIKHYGMEVWSSSLEFADPKNASITPANTPSDGQALPVDINVYPNGQTSQTGEQEVQIADSDTPF
jgi:single-stranded DNA-binding protein